jgi:hypothetical protein
MPEEDDLTAAQQEMKRIFASLVPKARRISPVAAAMEAGRRSAAHKTHLWQAVSAVLLVVSASSWFIRPPQTFRQPPVNVAKTTITTPPQPFAQLSDESVLHLEETVLSGGVDAMPARLPNVPSAPVENWRAGFNDKGDL